MLDLNETMGPHGGPGGYPETEFAKNVACAAAHAVLFTFFPAALTLGPMHPPSQKRSSNGSEYNRSTVAMTLISFYEVDHTYDRNFVIKYLTELETLLKNLISKHLTDKSLARVEQIFGVVKTPEFLDNIYVPKRNVEMRDIMAKVVKDLNNCIEAGVL